MAYGDRPSGKGKQTNNKYGPASTGGEMASDKGKSKVHDPSIKQIEKKYKKKGKK